jgi:hypothetical protein
VVGCSFIIPQVAAGRQKNKKRVFRHAEPQFSPQKNRWVLLRKTVISQTKQALSRPSVQFCPDLVDFYNQVRTEFERSE